MANANKQATAEAKARKDTAAEQAMIDAAANEQADTSAFEKIMGGEAVITEERSAPEETPEEDAGPETEGESVDPEAASEPSAETQEPQLSADEQAAYESALTNLRYVNAPSSALDTMSPQEVIEWGKKVSEGRTKQQAKIDDQAGRIKKLEDSAPAPGKVESREGVPPTTLDLSEEVLKPLADQLNVDLAEAKKTFEPVFQAVLDHTLEVVTAQLTAELKPLGETLQRQAETEDQRIVRENVERLSVFSTDLGGDQELQDKLVDKVMTLAKTGSYQNPNDAFNDAYKILIGPIPSAAESEEEGRVRSARRNGSVTTARRRPERTSMSKDEYDAKVMDRIMDGDSEGAHRIPRPTPINK